MHGPELAHPLGKGIAGMCAAFAGLGVSVMANAILVLQLIALLAGIASALVAIYVNLRKKP